MLYSVDGFLLGILLLVFALSYRRPVRVPERENAPDITVHTVERGRETRERRNTSMSTSTPRERGAAQRARQASFPEKKHGAKEMHTKLKRSVLQDQSVKSLLVSTPLMEDATSSFAALEDAHPEAAASRKRAYTQEDDEFEMLSSMETPKARRVVRKRIRAPSPMRPVATRKRALSESADDDEDAVKRARRRPDYTSDESGASDYDAKDAQDTDAESGTNTESEIEQDASKGALPSSTAVATRRTIGVPPRAADCVVPETKKLEPEPLAENEGSPFEHIRRGRYTLWKNGAGLQFCSFSEGDVRVLLKIRVYKFKYDMPEDSLHLDRFVAAPVEELRWLSREEYEDARANYRLASQKIEAPRAEDYEGPRPSMVTQAVQTEVPLRRGGRRVSQMSTPARDTSMSLRRTPDMRASPGFLASGRPSFQGYRRL